MLVVHSLTLLEANDTLCAADREGGRVICFDAGIENPANMGRVRGRFTLDEGEKPYAIAAKGEFGSGIIFCACIAGETDQRRASVVARLNRCSLNLGPSDVPTG